MNLAPIALFALDIAVKGFVLLGATAAVALLLRRASSALRHAVWVAGAAGVLLLPAAGVLPVDLRLDPATLDGAWAGRALPRAAAWTTSPVSRAPAPSDIAAETAGHAPGGVAGEPVGLTRARGGDALEPTLASGDVTALSSRSTGDPSRPNANSSDARFTFDANAVSAVALGIWLGGALLLLGRLVVRIHAANRLLASATPYPEAPAAPDGVRVLEHPEAAVPMTWGLHRPAVVLPVAARGWDDARLEAVLVHELAHVARRDTLTLTLASVVRALHWFNPLALVALRRIEDTQEFACDDHVLARGADAPEYADHLLSLARTLSRSRRPVPALGVVPPRRRLEGRLRAMLDPQLSRKPLSWTRAAAVAALTLPGLVLLAGLGVGRAEVRGGPDPRDQADPTRQPDPASGQDLAGVLAASGRVDLSHVDGEIHMDDGNYELTTDGTWTMNHEDEDLDIWVRMQGRVVFAEDETGIVALDDGASFEVKYDDHHDRVEIRFLGNDDGPERRFKLNGDTRDWGPEADAWMAKLIPVVFRHSTFAADKRVARILKQSGVEGVLAEIALIDSDYAERVYYKELLTQADLEAEQLRGILADVTGKLNSDYELAQLLIQVQDEAALDDAGRLLLVRASATLQSDYEHRRVLAALISGPQLDTGILVAVLETARNLQSDYELAELLTGVSSRYTIPAAAVETYLEAAATLESDYELGRTLRSLVDNGALDAASAVRAVEIGGRELSSDHELARFLLRVAETYPLRGELRTAYRDAARSLQSDHEENRVLNALADAETYD